MSVKHGKMNSLVGQFHCVNQECEFHNKNYEQNCASVHNTGVYPEDCADSLMELSDSAKLEWIWANCSVIHRDVVEQWDVEHCLWRGKDERAFIEAHMPNDLHQREQNKQETIA